MRYRAPFKRRRQSHFTTLAFPILIFCAIVGVLLLIVRAVRRNETRHVTPELDPSGGRGLMVITASNWMYREFLSNFACNLKNIGVKAGPLVYALDKKTADFAGKLGLSHVLIGDEEGDEVQPGNFQRHGPRSFNHITKNKLEAVHTALTSGLDVLLSDADIYWCSDAAEILKKMMWEKGHYQDADVVIQAEANYRTLNSGFYYVRSGENSIRLFKELVKNNAIGAHDQDVVNKVFCEEEFGGKKIVEDYGGVPYRCESQGAVIKILPTSRFPSGAELFDGEMVLKKSRKELKLMCNADMVVVHNNFIRANKKKARFIQKGMWHIKFEGDQPICMKEPVPESDVAARTCGSYC